jgi:superfamily II DNA helicase RecQ
LPIPVTTSRPVELNISATASANVSSTKSDSFAIELLSESIVFLAEAIIFSLEIKIELLNGCFLKKSDIFSLCKFSKLYHQIRMNLNEIDIHKELKKYFGFNQFKGLQEPVIKSILAKRNSFVIMPTGGGKSLWYCYCGIAFNCVNEKSS